MAKPTPESFPSLLVTELWGIGDVALAVPFLRTAVQHARVTVLAKSHATHVLSRWVPETNLIVLEAPWASFQGKYRLHLWPWSTLRTAIRTLREARFDMAVSARPDPRDHLLLFLSGARTRLGFPRAGSSPLLNRPLDPPAIPHRSAHWAAVAASLGWPMSTGSVSPTRAIRRISIHTGAGHAVRRWPVERYDAVAQRLRAEGMEVTFLDETPGELGSLIESLGTADAFIGNDSGPGHLAALLGVPTFTVFGPQLPQLFAPTHPQAGWIEGAPCTYKPCFDRCRYDRPHCLFNLEVDQVWSAIQSWLGQVALKSAP